MPARNNAPMMKCPCQVHAFGARRGRASAATQQHVGDAKSASGSQVNGIALSIERRTARHPVSRHGEESRKTLPSSGECEPASLLAKVLTSPVAIAATSSANQEQADQIVPIERVTVLAAPRSRAGRHPENASIERVPP